MQFLPKMMVMMISLTWLPRMPSTKPTSDCKPSPWTRMSPAPRRVIAVTNSKPISRLWVMNFDLWIPGLQAGVVFLTSSLEEVVPYSTEDGVAVMHHIVAPLLAALVSYPNISNMYTCRLNDMGQGCTIYCYKFPFSLKIYFKEDVHLISWPIETKLISNRFGRGQGSCNCTGHLPIHNLFLKKRRLTKDDSKRKGHFPIHNNLILKKVNCRLQMSILDDSY